MEAFSCQPLFDRLTHVAIKTGALKDFDKLTTSLEKIKFCWNTQVTYDGDTVISFRNEIQQILEVLYRQSPEHGKSESLASQAKDKGSKAYLKKKDSEAHLNYTECLRLAPEYSSVLPLAYGNRSAVLFQMARYKEALEDMAQAEKNGYPSSLLHKLLARQCSCHIMLDEKDQAESVLDKCKKHLLVIHSEAKEKFEKTIADLEHKVNSLHSKDNIKTDDENLDIPHLFQGENPKVAYMSSALDMRVNESYGRHIVATEPIPKSSVAFVEKPYAAILLPEHHHTHCHSCFSLATNPLPCEKCRDAVFCKEECRENGRVWHQYECGILHILSAIGIAHLALRVIFITGWKLYCKISAEDIKEMTPGVGSDNVYNGRDLTDGYRAVFHLMPHLDNSAPEDQLQYCLAADLLASVVLERTSFVKLNILDGEDTSNDKFKDIDIGHLASAIMRHIAQLVSNAHAVTQIMTHTSSESAKIEEVAQKRIASAIYSTASLMNHSCQPNIINSFFKDLLIIRTIQDVKPDDQIYNCYGPHYCRQTFQERQESLKQQYFFTCKCGPCTEPHYKLREAAWSGFHCEHCGGISSWTGGEDMANNDMRSTQGLLICLECHRTEKPSQHFVRTCTKVTALHEAGEEALESGDVSRAVANLRKAIKVGSKVYLAQNHYFITIRDTLAKTLGHAGYFESCYQELRECIRATESRYGSESVEFGHELLKSSDVLELAAATTDILNGELQKVNKKIDKIFTLNYGPRWKKYLKI